MKCFEPNQESKECSTQETNHVLQNNQNRFGNAFLQEQLNNGSALVLGSAANSEFAYDDSFSPHLLETLQDNPNESLETILSSLDSASLSISGNQEHHVTTAQYGNQHTNENTGNKQAILIANENYRYENPLETPISEANQMASELESRNYNTEIFQDQDSVGMETAWMNMIERANPGDELVAFFGGHGKKAGLVGVEHTPAHDDILENALISSMVQKASSQGKHMRFIMDSCHSGSTVASVRENYTNTFDPNQATEEQSIAFDALQRTQLLKEDLMEDVSLREAFAENVSPQGPEIAQYDQATIDTFGYYFEEIGEIHTLISKISEAQLPPPPVQIIDHETLGRQIDYCDELMNFIQKLL